MFRVMVNPDQKDWVQKSPLIKFAINSSIGSASGLAPFKINSRYMPIIMTELRDADKAPPGVQTFAQQALHNMAVAHDVLIEVQVFQTYYADRRQCKEPDIKVDNLVYLSTKSMAMPKGRARKLMPKFIKPYKVIKTYPETSNYMLELLPELTKRRVYLKYHVSLCRPHHPNNDVLLLPNRRKAEPYNFSAPEDTEWYIDKIIGYQQKEGP
jgi:hypothetical protein